MSSFVCSICYASFGNKGALANHNKFKHTRRPVQANSPFLKWLRKTPAKASEAIEADELDVLEEEIVKT